MRKIIPYLLLLYLFTFVGLAVYNKLSPPPPPKPPGAWELTWREYGNIVAFAAIAMLSMIQIAIGLFILGGVLVLLKKGWTIWAHTVGRSGGLAPVIRDKNGGWLDPNPEGAVIAAAIAAHSPKVTAGMTGKMMQAAFDRGRLSVQDTTYLDIPQEPLLPDVNLPRLVSIYDIPSLQQPALPIGVTEEGHLELPLHNLGNGLVGGLPGGGKSELLASMMVGLMRFSPDGRLVQIAVIDTKRVDFGNIPPDIAPLWQPVAREVEDGKELIAMLAAEAERRFLLLEKHRARSLRSYNALPDVEPLPYLVLFIDEIADWAGDKAFEKMAILIGRKGRAAGITLVAATQRTGVKEISSSLRAVMGFAVAFRTRNNTDSRLILGEAGAETISIHDKGRCLVWTGERLLMAQAYYAGIDEGRFDQFTLSLPKKSTVRDGSWRGASSVRKGSPGGAQVVRTGARTGSNPLSLPPNPSKTGDHARAVRTGTPSVEERIRKIAPKTPGESGLRISMQDAQLVYQAYQRAGSIKGLQRRLWPNVSTGGHRFYWLRDIIEQIEGRSRSKPTVEIVQEPASKSTNGRQNGHGRSFARTVERPRAPQEAQLRQLIEKQGRRVQYATALELARQVKQAGSFEALHRRLWPTSKIYPDRIRWMRQVVAQIERGAPDSYGPVVVVGWPNA